MIAELQAYVEAEILPRYDAFDKAHQRPHVERIEQWLRVRLGIDDVTVINK